MIDTLDKLPPSKNSKPNHPQQKRPRILLAMYWWEERVFDGVARYAAERDWIIDSRMRWNHSEEYLANWRGDGIIANPGFTAPLKSLVSRIKESRIPTVGLQAFGEYESLAKVVVDHEAVGREGARHLISREFRTLAFVKCAENHLEKARCEGFRKAAAEAGLSSLEINVESLRNVLLTLEKPIGLMATNDTNAIEVMRICSEMGLSIPNEVAIVGADDTKIYCEHAEVPLTSVRCNFEEQGYRAAEILDSLLCNNPIHQSHIKVSTKGVSARASTDTLGVQDEIARKTLVLIRQRFRENLKIREVAEMVGLSSRRLQISFRDSLGFTMSDELVRLRINHAKFLLEATDEKIDSIAYDCGFSNRHHFIRTFARELNMTPTKYRTKISEDAA
ncbi:substrate-binding domain-containing protein [Pelagicoccus albus]|uniref:Substrate-binding domain-containing protein n=1 Tax=Pelagicoccus albus TaxID=415222 RepID=A0A7X1B669_9BACT|nr:substrate-binding domain-containing protein [Pelagicoccus albus]MBC2606114.1 substrate-binding domain-containing protein [Pelagicoccus albus]